MSDFIRNHARRIPPKKLAAYATLCGWTKGTNHRGVSYRWYDGEGTFMATIPFTAEIADYPMVIEDLIERFSKATGKTWAAIMRQLLVGGWLLIGTTATHHSGKRGVISKIFVSEDVYGHHDPEYVIRMTWEDGDTSLHSHDEFLVDPEGLKVVL